MLRAASQSRLFKDWTQSSMSEQLVHIRLFEAFWVLQLCVIKAAATPVGLRHLMCIPFIFLDQPLETWPWHLKWDYKNRPELRVFVFGLVGVNRTFVLSKKPDESCILGPKRLHLILQFNPWRELMQTQCTAGNTGDWASRASHTMLMIHSLVR